MADPSTCDDRAMQLLVFFDAFGIPERVGVATYEHSWVHPSEVESLRSKAKIDPPEAVLSWLMAVAEAHKPPRLM